MLWGASAQKKSDQQVAFFLSRPPDAVVHSVHVLSFGRSALTPWILLSFSV